ncbi:TPA: hypothetical protein U1B40_000270 [Streptococcus suis]|uniref:hypothetical protein n=1 Tax=Streptococcus suis TaxID=1307 RepID=UPI0019618123|nr:hypothetical protein [Streptococcus suis]MBM7136856.1 hypothetical protein [Streptococcus suis]MBY4600969.1 hypothetical protein [Streptococcus suis]MCO8172266.1 hypothetical protein [Streptococcus suis]MCO8180649.1 hypothetical protein [Streptococcus suis]MCO8190779.1 hypothetical protein [Streptococcus suis]
MNTELELINLVQKGYILYQKNGKIEAERTPDFGTISLHFQSGKFTHLENRTIKK